MLPKKERLTRKEFSTFFPLGKRFHSPLLTVVYAPHTTFHASAVVSKKIEKHAVGRNKFRRRIYAIFERKRRERSFTGVFICIAKNGAAEATFTQLEEELFSLIHKTGVLG
jgi:ribonuclease P protein component